MYKSLRIVAVSSYLQIRTYFRVKEALFFTIIFPIFLFILFGNLWGFQSEDYIPNLLTGIICMTICSDALFTIGPILKTYTTNNILKFLKNLPFNFIFHFFGFFVSRIVINFFTIINLVIAAILVFHYTPSSAQVVFYFFAVFVGMIVFSFMSLSFSFFSSEDNGRGTLNFVFYAMLFLSGAFYPVNHIHPILNYLSLSLPLTHLIAFIRGNVSYLAVLLFWMILFGTAFYYLFKRKSVKR